MNKEFKRMQQLAGIKEIKIMPSGVYAKILSKYIKDDILTQEEYLQDDAPESVDYFSLLRQNPPIAGSAEEVANEIMEIDSTLSEFIGEYPGAFYSEAIIEPLINMGKKKPDFRPYIRQVINTLHKQNDRDNEEIEEYEEFMLDQWRDDIVYQDILDLYVDHIYSLQNFKYLHFGKGEILPYLHSLKNHQPKVNSLEELASTLVTINNTIFELKTNEFSYDGVDAALNQISISHPEYKSVIDTLLGSDLL